MSSSGAPDCIYDEPVLASVDADVVVIVDPSFMALGADTAWWIDLSSTWDGVSAAFILPDSFAIPGIPSGTCDCMSTCDNGPVVLRYPNEEEPFSLLVQPPLYDCIFRAPPPGGEMPTRHIWLLTAAAGETVPTELDLVLSAVGSPQFHVSCPGCGGESRQTALEALADDNGGIAGTVTPGETLALGAFVGMQRVQCEQPFAPPVPDFDPNLLTLELSLPFIDSGTPFPLERVEGPAACSEVQLEVPFEYFLSQGPDSVVLCPLACSVARFAPHTAVSLLAEYCAAP